MKVFDKVNMIYGAIAAIGVAILGKYWFLFAGFLILNVIDYATGFVKAKYYEKNESSAIGAKGVWKKSVLLDRYWTSILHVTLLCRDGKNYRHRFVIHDDARMVYTGDLHGQ